MANWFSVGLRARRSALESVLIDGCPRALCQKVNLRIVVSLDTLMGTESVVVVASGVGEGWETGAGVVFRQYRQVDVVAALLGRLDSGALGSCVVIRQDQSDGCSESMPGVRMV